MTKVKQTKNQYGSTQEQYYRAHMVQKARITHKIVVSTGTKEEKVLRACVTRYSKEKGVLMATQYDRYGRYEGKAVLYDSRTVLEEVVRMTGLEYEIMDLDQMDDVF